MSTERKPIDSPHSDTINVTSFSGGSERGGCIQLTQLVEHEYRYVQLDKGQALALIADLASWLGEAS